MIAGFVRSLAFAGGVALSLLPGIAIAQSPQAAGAPSPAVTQVMALTDGQVRGFLDAMDDLRTLPGASGESTAIIRKHGFKDTIELQKVAYNAAMAYGVFSKGGKEAVRRQLDASQAKQAQAMEKARQHLSPEQWKAVQAQMGAGMGAAEGLRDVPDENVKLVGRYADRMATLGRR